MYLGNNFKDLVTPDNVKGLNMKYETGLNGYEYGSFVDYNIDICDIWIYKYLQIFTNLQILIINSKFTNLQIQKLKKFNLINFNLIIFTNI